ncbi:MAG: hypothetical protein P4L76_17860 [Beijerinckiaceae bacterium]|nr:hypothetical protein [Beijerinckiaceae bacterium]
MTKPEETCYNPERQADAKKAPVVRRGLAYEKAITPAMISAGLYELACLCGPDQEISEIGQLELEAVYTAMRRAEIL